MRFTGIFNGFFDLSKQEQQHQQWHITEALKQMFNLIKELRKYSIEESLSSIVFYNLFLIKSFNSIGKKLLVNGS